MPEIEREQSEGADALDPVEEVEVAEEFHVDSDETANWVVRKIVEARAYAKRCADWCVTEQARAQRTEEFFIWRFGAELRRWLDQRLAERGGRTRSVNLPGGKVGLRRVGPLLVIEDEMSVLEWVKVHKPELVVVNERVSKSGLNALVKECGQVPDNGVRIEPEHDKFYVS